MTMIRPETEMKDSGIQWLGNIPKEWSIIKGKYILKQLSRSVLESDNVVTCFRDGEVTLRSNRRELGFTNSLKEIGYQGVEPGDLVVHGMDGFAGAIGISDSRGKMSPIINVLESGECKKYLMYYLRGLAFVNVFLGLSTGIRERSCDLRWNKLANLEYTIPPLSEQQAIADYLDETCSKIDEIIAEAKASIDEYKNLRESLISNATTQGIKKNRCMKSSGVEWVLEIPSDWDMIPAKVLFSQSNERKHVDDVQLTASQKYGIISQVEYMKRENSRIVIATQGIENWKHVEPNDFIISLRSFQGGLEKSDVSGCITWHYVVLKANNDVYYDYFKWLFKSDKYINALQGTCNFIRDGQDLRFSNFVQVPLLVVPIEEQKEIADYLNKKVPKIDSLISEKESLINDLEAYKKSLIYEVVTGKRKVV